MLASASATLDNQSVMHPKPDSEAYPQVIAAEGALPRFRRGALILVTLQSPREKFFGGLISLVPAGLVFCGVSLDSLDDFISQIRDGEEVRPGTLFFPMHRVERLELDQRSGDVPSLGERFLNKSGVSATEVFGAEAEG